MPHIMCVNLKSKPEKEDSQTHADFTGALSQDSKRQESVEGRPNTAVTTPGQPTTKSAVFSECGKFHVSF